MKSTPKFHDRATAGTLLAHALADYRRPDVVVLAIARGGIAVARPVAETLGLPIDVMVVRHAHLPQHPNVVMGAATARGSQIPNERAVRQLHADAGDLHHALARAQLEAARMEAGLRRVAPMHRVDDRIVLVVDDGVSSGMTMRAAISDLKALRAREIVVATPVISPGAREDLVQRASAVVALAVPDDFVCIGQYYESFGPIDEAEVRALLTHPLAAPIGA